jgi:restriction endonuclease S subunit
MSLLLKQLVDIKSGLVLSRKKATPQSIKKIKYKVVSLKSFSDDGVYNHEFADDFEADNIIKDEYQLQKGDIVLRLREPNIAIYIDQDYQDTIISSLLIVIRVENNSIINPLYLTHYLNSIFVKKQLQKDIRGTSIAMIKVKDVENLLINLPSIDIQNKLTLQQQLAINEIKLLEELIKEKKEYNKIIFQTVINQGKQNG